MPEHSTAIATMAAQARSPGITAGQNHTMGTSNASAAPSMLPVAVALVAPWTVSVTLRVAAIVAASLVGLLALGALGARLGRAPMLRPALRVGIGGAAAMIIAYLVGRAFNVSVGG